MSLVLFDVDERGVATVTLNRPERLNAINMAMRDLIWEYLMLAGYSECPSRLPGEGRCFSAGREFRVVTAPRDAAREARQRRDLCAELLAIRSYHRAFTALLRAGRNCPFAAM